MSQLAHEATATADRRVPLVSRLEERYAALVARGVAVRPFELRLADRSSWRIGEGEPTFTLRVTSERGERALAASDELQVAEAYMDGDLDIEGSFLAALKYRAMLSDRRPFHYLWETYLQPLVFGQVKSDKKWIKEHYDIHAEFFVLWLDESIRGYSHGFFDHPDESIETGIRRKFQYAFDACGMQAGDRVLDIGGGWGSFLQFAGEQGVLVTSLTISAASENYMNALIARTGLPGRAVRQHLLEYTPGERFDAIVNLGVTEHLPDYRRTLAQYQRLLKPGRRIYLDAYSGNRHGMPSFISKWGYQGNTSPLCLERYLTELARTPFELLEIQNDRINYFLTCKKWAENLERVRDQVVSRWGQHLYRRFRLYLWSAANSFETRSLSAHRMVLELPADAG